MFLFCDSGRESRRVRNGLEKDVIPHRYGFGMANQLQSLDLVASKLLDRKAFRLKLAVILLAAEGSLV